MARKECIAIVIIIIIPPIIVSVLGLSFTTIQTHIGPIITSNKKNKLTSAAVIYLGAIVTRTNGIATHRTHINGTIIISVLIRLKLFTKTNAKAAVPSFPITAAGTKSLSLANLARFAFTANQRAVMKPNISPTIFPNFTES